MKHWLTKKEWEEEYGPAPKVRYSLEKNGRTRYDRRYDKEIDLNEIIIESNKAKDLHDHFLSNTSPERSRRDDWRTEDRPTTRMLGVGRSS